MVELVDGDRGNRDGVGARTRAACVRLSDWRVAVCAGKLQRRVNHTLAGQPELDSFLIFLDTAKQ